ncbi:Alpha-N-acetylglucosaminidase [Candidatus Sulfotelmatomonas gaucii]|uniref:Alpha-N-acetylglucosaminidase n=1 Tax=Candidatus Sulfuritelmatomonas gaucii TaxID=2043161 RepID=A0A2N9LPC4_9BACT|nr:Alpha-N-acetylglucosaminidase [Candidatus Sulfotelmatomonas gaucii]
MMPALNGLLTKALTALCILFATAHVVHAADAKSGQLQPARAALKRLIPSLQSQISLSKISSGDGGDAFRISGTKGNIQVEATSNVAALFGVNWYLRYVAHLQISSNGDQLRFRGKLPGPPEAIEKKSPYRYRYALNENTDGYSTPYWDWAHWEREIDLLAASGINAMLVERGADEVLYRTFRELGYPDGEIRQWIAQPAHQNWQLMGNLCCFDEPISRQLLERRTQSARQMVARLRELGITPVLPGYFGIVPEGFAKRHPGAHVVAQGTWNGFSRPGWLDPRDPLFAEVAAAFYRHERELFGDTSIYDMEPFQEGGTPGKVPVSAAAKRIQQMLNLAHPDALWMMLAWQDNPSPVLLEGVNRNRLLIVDIEQGRTPHEAREADFRGAHYLFGGLWEFGGRTTLGANLYDYAVRLPAMGTRPGSKMAGTAYFSEGLDTNPAAFTLFTEMAWREQPVDVIEWSKGYARSRYGSDDPHAERAWQILMQTVYSGMADSVSNHGERDAATESLFAAQPSLTATKASIWAPDQLRYAPEELESALTELLEAGPAVRATATYQYDLVDVARQVISNWSRAALPQIKDAYDHRDEAQFQSLAQRWLKMMDLEDAMLATNSSFLLGRWLDAVTPWAASDGEMRRLQFDARSILTTWGDRTASEAGLHDYGNKEWAGLISGYYRPRWQLYFDKLAQSMKEGTAPGKIDWFQIGERWNGSLTGYTTRPQGNSWSAANKVAQELGILCRRPEGSGGDLVSSSSACADQEGLRATPK